MSGLRQQHLRGVFSSQEVRKIGTGTTSRKTVQKIFWYVEEDEDGRLMVQPMNANYIPTGSKKLISEEDLLSKYSPEPEFYIQSVYPKMRELDETIVRGDQMRQKGETFSAEDEYSSALEVDEENVRANFGIGLTYLSRGEVDKAGNIFDRLVHLEGAFEEEHKHLFNEFGMSLRKNKMLKQSLEYYQKAIELSAVDENLFINIARVFLELKDIENCIVCLENALILDPVNEIASKFVNWLGARKLITEDKCQELLNMSQNAQTTQDSSENDAIISPEAATS